MNGRQRSRAHHAGSLLRADPGILLFCALVVLPLMTVSARADELDSAWAAVSDTRPILDLRLRSETVDQDGVDHAAQAITLRARIGFESGRAWGTSMLVDGDFLQPLDSRYNSTVNGRTQFPVVADPETYQLDRLQLTNTSLPDTSLTLGRQRINLDDQRFVGDSGWRQNEQTFDAVRLVNESIAHLTVDLTYLDQVNRVFGKNSPVGRYHGANYLTNVAYHLPAGTLTAFAYLLDLRESPQDSSGTYGVRYAGEHPIREVTLGWLGTYATQKDRANNPLRYRDDYYMAELTGTWRQYSLGAGLEVMEGDGVKGFATPLATYHRFDGWADKFAVTPPNGLARRYASAGYQLKGLAGLDLLAFNALYDRFTSDRLRIDYGREVDLQARAKRRHFTVLLQYARYDAHSFATDTSKYWLELDYTL